MAISANSKILASDVSGAVKSFTVSGKTVTFTKLDGTTGTFTTQDTNTTYSAATSSALGLVKIGSNITNSSGTISITKANVTSALGYTPPSSSSTMPDYSAGVQITVTTSGYTAPSDGYFIGLPNMSGAGDRLFYINGAYMGEECDSGGVMCLPVSKGDIISTSESSAGDIYFYPVKGA